MIKAHWYRFAVTFLSCAIKVKRHQGPVAAHQLSQCLALRCLASARTVCPAQCAVSNIDPQFAQRGLADKKNVGGRGRAQARPEVRRAALFFEPRVAQTAKNLFNAACQHGGAGFDQRQVAPALFNRASHAQVLAQAANSAFNFVVNGADVWR